MSNWYRAILKIKPDGKAFRSILKSKIFYEMLAYGFNLVKEYAVLTINDQVWYINSNFNPEPWENRYEINVSEFATLDERRQVVKSYMLFPQSQNRLSRDYIENTLHESGFTELEIIYNPTGINSGFYRTNDIYDEKTSFSIGSLVYNNFIIDGTIGESYYYQALYLALSIKPLQVGCFDTIQVLNAVALDNNLAIALDDNLAIALTVL